MLTTPTIQAQKIEFELGQPDIIEHKLEKCDTALSACERLVEAQDELITQQEKELDLVRSQVQEVEERSKWSWILMGILSAASFVGGVLIGTAI